MDQNEIKVKTIISKIIKIPVDRLANADDLVEKHGMDSLARVEIVTELEKAFDINIDDKAAMELRSVNKCLEFIKEALLKK